MRKTSLARTAIACTALSLVLTACGGSDDAAPGESGGDGESTGAAAEPATWPLTGLKVKGGSAAKNHPVFVVKIDNTTSSQPQVGLGKADLVVEELVEGGLTRLATFFYSELPTQVGPVRSMRASDIGIVKPVDGTMVTSGAAGVTIGRLNAAGVPFVQEGQGGGFHRDSGRSSLYSVIADLQVIAREKKTRNHTPAAYLDWGAAADLPKGVPASTLSANFGGHQSDWAFEGGTYRNTNTNAAENDQFRADNVLVLKVPVGDAGYKDPGGNFVPETKFEGTGEAVLFHGGKAIKATWTKKGADGQITLSTPEGDLPVPAGKTWIELVPAAGGSVQAGNVTYQK